jgi:hypothetical protein
MTMFPAITMTSFILFFVFCFGKYYLYNVVVFGCARKRCVYEYKYLYEYSIGTSNPNTNLSETAVRERKRRNKKYLRRPILLFFMLL